MGKVLFKLEIFEGPLDLLLSLIGKKKIDICDINISDILTQYMEYLDIMKELQLDITADFLAMASQLMYIKSRSMLPVENDDEEDPKQVLIHTLEEYKRCKEAADILKKRTEKNGYVFVKAPEILTKTSEPYEYTHTTEELKNAYLCALRRVGRRLPPPVNSFSGIVGKEPVPVEDKLMLILKELSIKKILSFMHLLKSAKSRSEIVATFLAVLELTRSKRIKIIPDVNNNNEYTIKTAEIGDI